MNGIIEKNGEFQVWHAGSFFGSRKTRKGAETLLARRMAFVASQTERMVDHNAIEAKAIGAELDRRARR